MIFADLPNGSSVFVDGNTLIYHFQPHPGFGAACTDLLERIERQELLGFTSTHVLSELAHRLMTLEACVTFGWPYAGIAQRLANHLVQVQSLTRFRLAISEVFRFGLRVLTMG
jgi:predicted nucleic acid-binding protein